MLGSWFRQIISESGTAGDAVRPLSEEQEFFLRRLERLASLQRNEVMWQRLNEAGQELLRWAIYSSYCDCVDLGIEHAARRALHPEYPAARVGQPAGESGL